MNNNNNKKSSVVSAVVVLIAISALGYFLFKNLPQNPNRTADVGDMHGGSAEAPASGQLNSLVGKLMPDIQLSDKNGKIYGTADFKGKNTVLFFNEGLMCYPACWNQIAAFGSDQRFNSDEIQAISVVVDSANDWRIAVGKMPQLAKATTMFDMNADASRRLGVLTTASSMHKGSLPGHTYIVLDKNAAVRYVFDDPNMTIANDMLFSRIGELK